MKIEEIIALLQQPGWRIRIEPDDFTNEYHLVGPSHNVTAVFHRMVRDGWLVSSPNGGCYVLSDAGRAAYMRSTDELGDGKLILPRAEMETIARLCVHGVDHTNSVCGPCMRNGEPV